MSYSLDRLLLEKTRVIFEEAQSIVLLPHIKPDGDALGACVALERLALASQKQVVTILPTGEYDPCPYQPKNLSIGTHTDLPDLIIICDTGTTSRIYYPEIFHTIPTIQIDHHRDNEIKAPFQFIQTEASSTCELVTKIIHGWGYRITPEIGEPLMYGVLSDTLSFKTQNTNSQTFFAAELLMEAGVNLQKLQQKTIIHSDPNIVILWGTLLSQAHYNTKKNALWISLREKDLLEKGFSLNSLVGFIACAALICTVDITALFVERADGIIKVSLRSKHADVNSIAKTFGGGGHFNASGITLASSLNDAIQEVTALF